MKERKSVERPRIRDQQGREQEWDWLIANFGAISLERAKVSEGVNQVYRIVRLQDSEGPAVQMVSARDQSGNPIEGITVVRHWADAPQLPKWPAPASMWRERGVYGATNMNGEIGFGMGRGDYYFAPSGGASAVWIADQAGPSDLICGLGMLGATNHRHLDIVYQLEEVDMPSPPPPLPVPSSVRFEIIDKDGQSQDLAWLEHYFGMVEHYVAPDPDAYRFVKLCEVTGVNECKITILNEDGSPAEGISVTFRRRDGTAGHAAETGASGTVRFPLENDAKYPVPGQGPYLTMVKKASGPSDAVIGLGRVMGTARHLDVTFQLRPGEAPSPPPSPPLPEPDEPPPPPPLVPPVTPPGGEERWEQIFGKVDQIIAILEEHVK